MKPKSLSELRQACGMSQEELAEKLSVHRTTLNRYEKGRITPKKSLLYMAAIILGHAPYEIEGYTKE